MNSEPDPNSPNRDGGIALVAIYLFLILLLSLMQIVDAYCQGTAVIQGQVTNDQGQALIGALSRRASTNIPERLGYDKIRSICSP